MEALLTPEALVALLTLTVLEIVLGIDNIIFISILSAKLPEAQRAKARQIGLMLALFGRVVLLLSIAYLARATTPLFAVFGHGVSVRDLVLLGGGLFLIAKSVHEIHNKLESHESNRAVAAVTFSSVITQILIMDLVFSLDSVITAIGMADQIPVMVAAVVIAMGVMLAFAGAVSNFVERHPTVKMLALSFLLLIGVMLVAEGTGAHISKGYVYFAMAFSVFVEMLNLRMQKGKTEPVKLHGPYPEQAIARAQSEG